MKLEHGEGPRPPQAAPADQADSEAVGTYGSEEDPELQAGASGLLLSCGSYGALQSLNISFLLKSQCLGRVSKTLPSLGLHRRNLSPEMLPNALHTQIKVNLHLCLIFQVELSKVAQGRWDTDAENRPAHWPQDGSDGVVRAVVGTVSQEEARHMWEDSRLRHRPPDQEAHGHLRYLCPWGHLHHQAGM